MRNPWLGVPLQDYEGHMESPGVEQLGPLSELFAEALALCHPESVAILGIAGGNGLEHVTASVKRIVGLDINPAYLDVVRERHSYLPGLELHGIDLADTPVDLAPVQLVHAALVFEHAGAGRCLENALRLVAPGGALSAVLQRPSEVEAAVSASRFLSIQNLKSHFTFIDPAWFSETLQARGLRLIYRTRRSLPAGKGFWMGVFRRE